MRLSFLKMDILKEHTIIKGRTTNTIVEMLEYIVKHDIYKVNEKKKRKKYKKVLQNRSD